ncbi:hypothetical protein Q8W37_08570 [Shimia thalassica]|uniref:hypothetical protein n=1 Tax=Shimia thalassica TaxID=1715693 RepID=UPI0027336888|nr:hypothetical protein [Shimia thalassica]MDP2579982.1 hypothetical protein [Shimia thalassica]
MRKTQRGCAVSDVEEHTPRRKLAIDNPRAFGDFHCPTGSAKVERIHGIAAMPIVEQLCYLLHNVLVVEVIRDFEIAAVAPAEFDLVTDFDFGRFFLEGFGQATCSGGEYCRAVDLAFKFHDLAVVGSVEFSAV